MRRYVPIAIVVVVALVAVLALFTFRGADRAPTTAVTEQGGERVAPPPAAPRVPAPETAPAPDTGFDIVRVSPDGMAVIAGRAEPGAEIVVRAGDKVVGTVTADIRGEWAMVPEEPLESGAVELRQEVRPPGKAPYEPDQVVVIVVPEREEGAPAEPGEKVIVLRTPRSGGASEVLQGPERAVEESESGGLSLGTIDYDSAGNVILSGEARPRSRVRAYIDNRPIGTVRADSEGRWLIEPDRAIAPGTYDLRLDQLDARDRVVTRLEVPFKRESPARIRLVDGQVVVQPGNNLWQIARTVYGSGVRYTVIYRANSGQIRDPDLIYPGQVFSLPETN